MRGSLQAPGQGGGDAAEVTRTEPHEVELGLLGRERLHTEELDLPRLLERFRAAPPATRPRPTRAVGTTMAPVRASLPLLFLVPVVPVPPPTSPQPWPVAPASTLTVRETEADVPLRVPRAKIVWAPSSMLAGMVTELVPTRAPETVNVPICCSTERIKKMPPVPGSNPVTLVGIVRARRTSGVAHSTKVRPEPDVFVKVVVVTQPGVGG